MKKFLAFLVFLILIGCGGTTQTEDNTYTSDTNVSVTADTALNGLDYLNYLREKAGMVKLNDNHSLDVAAENHAEYMYENNTTGHYEQEGLPGFTGYSPADRAVNAGYNSRYVLENVSYGQENINDSIDGLFGAIYHRLAFLNTTVDNIGIGEKDKYYVYDMGNTGLNYLCETGGYNGYGSYYVNVCADESLKIYLDDYDRALNSVKSVNPRIVLWPYQDADEIPPVFYSETPDPLPDYDVSGYPVSIEFNDYYYKDVVSMESFKLFDSNGEEITDVRVLNQVSDPNNELTAYQFALFPLQRLDWNSSYTAEAVYYYNGVKYYKTWKFKTKALPYPYYKITSESSTVYVKSSQTYAYYFVPRDGHDLIHGYIYTFPSGGDVQSGMIDYNTVWIKVTGSRGDRFEFSFDNGDKLTLIIK